VTSGPLTRGDARIARLVLAASLCACRPVARDAAQRAGDAPAPPLADARAPAAPPSSVTARWVVSARDAQSHGLSAVGFSLDEAPRSLIATRFPAQGTLALFSGPPGGPLGAIVEVDGLSGSDALSLRDALRTTPSVRIGNPRVLGEPEEVRLGGATRAAVSMLAGAPPARALYCVVMVPPPEGAPQGLLLWLYASGVGVPSPSCEPVMAHPAIAALATGFRVETR
jgi:hypothetical protein